ncbi:serine hydrolase domain-containing protein [Streptomyces sp. NPDC006798]|uniref:serine hydrolase domain-containing protein n=1 Tax=Streptomyces sp. NPDC006798 TaxID=3155462 RepID=UPI0033CAB8DD
MTRPPSRRLVLGAAAVPAALGLIGATAGPAAATTTRRPVVRPPETDRDRALRAAISDLSTPHATCAQLTVDDGAGGDSWYGSAGYAHPAAGRPPHPGDALRVGSVTKVFIAAVVLQEWAAGRIDLDGPIGRHLPAGLLPDTFGRITAGQLLDHTSGIPPHVGLPDESTPEAVWRHRMDRWTPEELLATVTHRAPSGTGRVQEYRGVNYLLLSLLIEELTGQTYAEAVATRIARPLGLRRTCVPGAEPRLRGPHIRGFLRMTDDSLRDITVQRVESSRGDGDIVSSHADLLRFHTALFSGELLPPHAADQLYRVPSVPMTDGSPARYGRGFQRVPVNGVDLWGKTGEQHGYRTRIFATRDLRTRMVLTYHPTRRSDSAQMAQRVAAVLLGKPGSGR